MSENTNIEREALLNLIDAYAKARAMHALEDLYGTSQSYTAELLEKQNAARAKVVASLSLPAAGQEPVAWRTFDGEGGYDYRTYDDNENYRAEWEQRNPNHKGWVEPLYAAPQPAVAAGWVPIETAPKDGSYLLLWEQYSETPFVGYWSGGSWSVSHEHVDAEGGWDGANVVDALSMPITHWMPLPPAPSTEGERDANA